MQNDHPSQFFTQRVHGRFCIEHPPVTQHRRVRGASFNQHQQSAPSKGRVDRQGSTHDPKKEVRTVARPPHPQIGHEWLTAELVAVLEDTTLRMQAARDVQVEHSRRSTRRQQALSGSVAEHRQGALEGAAGSDLRGSIAEPHPQREQRGKPRRQPTDLSSQIGVR